MQGYTQKSRDGNQTLPKERSQKQTEKGNPSQDSHRDSKAEGRTGGIKKAGRSKRPSDADSDDNPSSEASDAGRDADRSGSDSEPDKETAAEESDRSVTEITHSIAECERITGLKQTVTSAKTNKRDKLAKIIDLENCKGKAEKYRDLISLNPYGILIVK